jgi:hypothetical protein
MQRSKTMVVISIFIAQLLYLSYIYSGNSIHESNYLLNGWMFSKGELIEQGSLIHVFIAAAIKLGFSTHMKLRFLLEMISILGWILIYISLKNRVDHKTIAVLIAIISIITPLYSGQMWLPESILSIPLFIIAMHGLVNLNSISKNKAVVLIIFSTICLVIEPITGISLTTSFVVLLIQANQSKSRKLLLLTISLVILGVGIYLTSKNSFIDYHTQFFGETIDIYLVAAVGVITIAFVAQNLRNHNQMNALKYLIIASSLFIIGQLPSLIILSCYIITEMVIKSLAEIRRRMPKLSYGIVAIFIFMFVALLSIYSPEENTEILNENQLSKVITTLTNPEEIVWSPTYPLLYLSSNRIPKSNFNPAKVSYANLDTKQLPKVIVYNKQLKPDKEIEEIIKTNYDQLDSNLNILKYVYVLKDYLNQSLDLLSQQGMYTVLPMEQQNAGSTLGEITSDKTIVQSITLFKNNFSGIEISLATFGRSNVGTITFILKDSENNVLNSATEKLEGIKDNSGYKLTIPVIHSSRNKRYLIEIKSDAQSGQAITAYTSKDDLYPYGDLYVNGIKQKNDLTFRITTGN